MLVSLFVNWFRACEYVWVAIAILWLASALKTKPGVRKQSATSSLAYKVVAILAAFLLFDPHFAVGALAVRFRPPSVFLDAVGLAVTVLGAAFAVWARFLLGTNWSGSVMVKRNHELIQSGPYAIVRHPIYAGFSLGALGTALVVGELRAIAALILSVVAWRMKWGVEEAFMGQQFGSQYAEYKRRVSALIPWVW